METVTVTGNGDASIGVIDPTVSEHVDSFAAHLRLDQRRAARQLRNAIRRVVALHLVYESDLARVDAAACRDVYRFVWAAVAEHRARAEFQQMTLDLEHING